MYIKHQLIIISVLMATIFLSCNKENNNELPNSDPVTPVLSDSTLLWKCVRLDTTRTPGLDTIERFLFNYDSQLRLIHMSYNTRAGSSPSPSYSSDYQNFYFYNGSDTTPYKQIIHFASSNVNISDTIYYTYATNGLVASDSVRRQFNSTISPSYQLISVKRYNVAGTIVNVSSSQTQIQAGASPIVCNTNTVFNLTYSNGNIITEQQNSSGCSNSSVTRPIAYDNKPNPFFKALNIHYPVTLHSYFGTNQKNNVVQEYLITTGNNIRNDYIYGTNGLPSIVRWTDLSGVQRSYKGLFYYRKP